MAVQFSVECRLDDMEDCTAVEAVTSIVLAALRDSGVTVSKVTAEVSE